MFQTCPSCEGTGKNRFSRDRLVCDVCKGKKIINKNTGLPPERLTLGDILEQKYGYQRKIRNEQAT